MRTASIWQSVDIGLSANEDNDVTYYYI
jgi:hypothetical protein